MYKCSAACVTVAMALALAACGRGPSSPSTTGQGGSAFTEATPEEAGEGASSPRAAENAPGFSQSAQGFPFRRILCFGDSITYGVTSRAADGWHSLSPVEGYVPKLRRLLRAEYGEGIELISSGVGAETTSEGLERIDAEVRVYQPDLVLLLEGIIDVGNDNPPFRLVAKNLAGMMGVVIRRDSQVIMGTYPLLNPEGFRIAAIDNVPRLNDIIRREARAQGVLVADHGKAPGKDLTGIGPDGLHPNDNGYQLMAETWLEKIEELVARLST